jgi:hypothetical protein
MATTTTAFNPADHLRKLGGKDYLEVKWRLVWLRTEHPESVVRTELVKLDTEAGFALFKAEVILASAASATGYGSETRADFLDYIEKAETKAAGRALAALGFGTQFCEDFETVDVIGNCHPVDSPVEPVRQNGHTTPEPTPIRQAAPASNAPSAYTNLPSNLASPAQVKLIYLTGTRDLHLSEEELEEDCQAKYGRLPLHLTKREASEYIDALKTVSVAKAKRD